MKSVLVEIRNLTRRMAPRLPFQQIANAVFTQSYTLSLVFCGRHLSRRINREQRGKDKATNVLSFSLSKNTGEMFIDLDIAKREADNEGVTLTKRVAVLFIHGALHLKGLDHGRTMEGLEQELARKFL